MLASSLNYLRESALGREGSLLGPLVKMEESADSDL